MTRAVILAAGFGSRLMPLTSDRPKGLVDLCGRPLLSRQIAVLRGAGVEDITLVGGYRADRLGELGLPVVLNPEYDRTNMVESLMRARGLLDGSSDLIIAYGDIVYEPRVLETLLTGSGDLTIVADREWRALWQARMEDFSADVESFRVGEDGCVQELGRRPDDLEDVEGQYIGLIRVPASRHATLTATYDAMDRAATYEGKAFPQMYMTAFIQYLIDRGWCVRPAWTSGGWLEVDTLEDLARYEALAESGELVQLCDLDRV